jgi:alpha-tubulin suppressor-like RCC1 family protein
MALTAEGEAWSWGGNEDGKLGHARTEFDISSHVQVPRRIEDLVGVRVVAASCGGQHCAVVTGDGQVFCWGSNSSAQCGLGYRCAQVLSSSRYP